MTGYIAVLLLGAVPLTGFSAAPDPPHQRSLQACSLSAENHQFIQSALDGWAHASQMFLRIDPKPAPLMVLFDTTCTWYLAATDADVEAESRPDISISFAGDNTPVSVAPHDGTVRLPNGGQVPAQGMAFGSLAGDGSTPFFVLALLDVWRQNPRAAERKNLEDLILGVASHEIVHTRQLVEVGRRVEALQADFDVPEDVNDDIVETRFKDVSEFAQAHDRETDLFYRAADAETPAGRDSLTREALRVVRDRQAGFYTESDAVFEPLEELFLNMEGVAVWSAFRLENERRGTEGGEGWFERGRNSWSQDEGLALFLLIDAMVPDWQPRVLGSEFASPFQLLEEALRH